LDAEGDSELAPESSSDDNSSDEWGHYVIGDVYAGLSSFKYH
jgi:hypothetical protein